MLQRLKELKEMIENDCWKKNQIALIEEIIATEEENVRKQCAKNNKASNSRTACMQLLNNKINKNRPVLQKAKQLENGKIVLTDSYRLYVLNDNYNCLPLNDEEKDGKYPNVDCILNKAGKENEITLPLIEELKFLKKTKEEFIDLPNDEKYKMSVDFILNMYGILGQKITVYNNQRNIYVINDKKEIGILMKAIK